jgi:glucose uptake protein GlcU
VNSKRLRTQEVFGILKIIFGIFAVILIVLYYTGIYFTIFDEEATNMAKGSNSASSKGRKVA